MRCRVSERDRAVVATPDDGPVEDHHRANGYFALPLGVAGQCECQFKKGLVWRHVPIIERQPGYDPLMYPRRCSIV